MYRIQATTLISHPAYTDNSLDRGIFSVFIETAFKFLGFPAPPYPQRAGKFGTGKRDGNGEFRGEKKSY